MAVLLAKALPLRFQQRVLDRIFPGDAPPPLVIEPTAKHRLTFIHMLGYGSRPNMPRTRAMFGKKARDDVALVFKHDLAPKLTSVRWVVPHAPKRRTKMSDHNLGKGVRIPAWFDVSGRKFSSDQDWKGMCDAVRLLAEVVRHEVEDRGVPPENIVISGFSQGGCVALMHAVGQDAALFASLGEELPALDDASGLARWAAHLDARLDSDAPTRYRVGGVVAWRTFLPNVRMALHRELGLGFVGEFLFMYRYILIQYESC